MVDGTSVQDDMWRCDREEAVVRQRRKRKSALIDCILSSHDLRHSSPRLIDNRTVQLHCDMFCSLLRRSIGTAVALNIVPLTISSDSSSTASILNSAPRSQSASREQQRQRLAHLSTVALHNRSQLRSVPPFTKTQSASHDESTIAEASKDAQKESFAAPHSESIDQQRPLNLRLDSRDESAAAASSAAAAPASSPSNPSADPFASLLPPPRPWTDADVIGQRRCESWKATSIAQLRAYVLLEHSLNELNAPIDPFTFLQCAPCESQTGGAFMVHEDGTAQIVLCSNHLQTEKHFHNVLTHEMIHAYDYVRAELAFDVPEHHACTEVRAANLSGDCSWFQELKRGKIAFLGGQQRCVRRRAMLSCMANPSFKGDPDYVQRTVDKVYQQCYNDFSPFGSVPFY